MLDPLLSCCFLFSRLILDAMMIPGLDDVGLVKTTLVIVSPTVNDIVVARISLPGPKSIRGDEPRYDGDEPRYDGEGPRYDGDL